MIRQMLSSYVLYPVLEKAMDRDILSKLKVLRGYYQKPFEARTADMALKLYDLVSFASTQIPFYKRHYEGFSETIEKLRTDIKYFQDLPVVSRAHIFKDTVSFFNPAQTSGAQIHRRNTGGSTGASAFVFYDNEALDWTAATNLFAYEMTGKKRHHTECHLSSDLVLPTTFKDDLKQKIKCRSLNRMELRTGPLSDANLENVLNALRSSKPFLLQGHPSTVYALAEYIAGKYPPQKLFNVFESTGEVVTEKMVQEIEKQCGGKVFNRYGNAESGVVAHSLGSCNQLMVMDYMVYPEIVDSEITVTNLTNRFMPLIRYKTGDMATLEKHSDGYYLSNILGRIHDQIELNGVRYFTHYIQDFLDHEVRNVSEFQLTQNSKTGEVVLKVYPTGAEFKAQIKDAVEAKWPGAIRVEFVSDFSEFVRVGREGKFRHLLKL